MHHPATSVMQAWHSPFVGSLKARFLRLALWTYARRDGPKTLGSGFFPRRVAASSRTLTLQKSLSLWSSAALRPFRFRAGAAGMGGPASPEEKASGEYPKENVMTAIGYVTKQADGRYTGHLRTVSIQAEIDIVPNIQKNADAQPDFRVLTQGIEIGAGWTRKGETSGKDYVSLSIAAPEFGPKKLYANLGKAAGSEDKDLYAVIWNPAD
jgi:uncharacterized protein (DUF736 family)